MDADVTITMTKTVITGSGDAALAESFAAHKVIVIENAFGPDAASLLRRMREGAQFAPDEIGIDGWRLHEEPGRTGNILLALLNRKPMWEWVERITGIGPIASVGGQTAQFQADGGQHLDWHNDILKDRNRLLGITINLGEEPYEGGRFEMRQKGADELMFHFDHRTFGTMLVFLVDKQLEHRVTPVTAGGPRTVFGGWFYGRPNE